MAENKKISEFDELSEVTGEEYIPVVSNGQNKKVKASSLHGGVEEAPKDGSNYVRNNGQWAQLPSTGEGGTVVVDSELSDTSTNPVQNKAITSKLTELDNNVQNIITELSGVEQVVTPFASEEGKTIKNDGTIIIAVTAGAVVNTYQIEKGNTYYANGYSPTESGGNTMLAYYNESDDFISYDNPKGDSSAVLNYKLNFPENASFVKVFGNNTQKPNLVKLKEGYSLKDSVEKLNVDISNLTSSVDFLAEEVGGIEQVVTSSESEEGKTLKQNGTLTTASMTGAVVNTYPLDVNKTYYADGYCPSSTSGNTMLAYYDELGTFLSYASPGNSESITNYKLTIPTNAVIVKIYGNDTQKPNLKVLLGGESVRYIAEKLSNEVDTLIDTVGVKKEDDAIDIVEGKTVKKDGTLISAVTAGAVVNTYNLKEGFEYYANGYSVTSTSGNTMLAYYDGNGTFISYDNPGNAEGITNYKLTIPSGAATVKIFGNNTQKPSLNSFPTESIIGNIKTMQDDVEKLKTSPNIPLIYNIPLRQKTKEQPIKILFFGSSWFMCTWWYLNKIIAALGINAELHAYYIGHSEFKEWISLYNNDLTPFEGSEASRGATRNISTNGSDWEIKTYRSNYTAQQYRDDWYNDITTQDWDIIAFQQGAKQAPFWDINWGPYVDNLTKLIKANCKPWTTIAFNATWTPVTGNSYLSGLTMEQFQKANNDNIKRLIAYTGIYNVSPNGSVLWKVRASDLNNANNLADDGLHPNNGLPMYALSACFFETFIAPIYSVSVEQSTWLPNVSTQKALVSGSSFDVIDAEKQKKVFDIIRSASADRFDFL